MSTNPNGDIIAKIKANVRNLSYAGQRIARLFILNPEFVVNASVKDVADSAKVSEASVIRFGSKMGFEGFKDVKIKLTQQLAVARVREDAGVKPPQFGNGWIESIFRSAIETITMCGKHCPPERIVLAVRHLVKARRVLIFGVGGSSAMMAQEAQNRLFRLNIPCTVYTDSYQQRMSAATLSECDIALFVSSTGLPRCLVESADLCHYYGATSIAITNDTSALGKVVDICLNVPLNQNGVAHGHPNPMRFAQLAMVDALSNEAARQLGEKSDIILKRVRCSVAPLHGIVPQQPIGD